MKSVFFVFAAAAVVAFAGCGKKDSAPAVPPTTTVDVPNVPTTVAPVPTTEAPPLENKYLVDASQAFCKPDGAKFNCGNPVWYGFKGCSPDTDGDRQTEGTMYAKSFEDIVALMSVHDSAATVKFKDGTFKTACKPGSQACVGFKAECREL